MIFPFQAFICFPPDTSHPPTFQEFSHSRIPNGIDSLSPSSISHTKCWNEKTFYVWQLIIVLWWKFACIQISFMFVPFRELRVLCLIVVIENMYSLGLKCWDLGVPWIWFYFCNMLLSNRWSSAAFFHAECWRHWISSFTVTGFSKLTFSHATE